MAEIDTLHLRSHAEGVCRDHDAHAGAGIDWEHVKQCYNAYDGPSDGFVGVEYLWQADYEYSLDILCMMALTEALGLEYGGFVN
jgi:hypothetical protein